MPGISKIIGIYHADGGIIGEFKYITGKFFANSQVKKGSSKAKNDEHNKKLWELSEEFVKPFL